MLFEHGFIRNTAKRLAMGVCATVALAGFAGAATITTTTFNTWKTAAYQTGAPTELNFLAINASSYNTSSGITLTASGGGSAATFTGMSGANYLLAGDIYAKTLATSSGAGASMSITFANPQNAFLLSFANLLPYTIILSDGQVFTPTTKMAGFSVSHTVSSLMVTTSPGSQIVLNDFYFGVSSLAQDAAPSPDPGSPAATPEPATVMLLAGGCLFLFGAKKHWVKA